MKEVERRMEKMGEDRLRLGLNRGLSHFCDCAVRPGRAMTACVQGLNGRSLLWIQALLY